MARVVLFVCFNYFLWFEISQAQYSRGLPKQPTTANPILAAASRSPTELPSNGIKCYPETATAYFLPMPPSSPKATVLNTKEASEVMNANFRDVSSTPLPDSANKYSNKVFPPPSPSFSVSPDFIDEYPSLLQNRFSRLAETGETSCGCETCANLIKKFPIYNFDRELLNGFLSSIGL